MGKRGPKPKGNLKVVEMGHNQPERVKPLPDMNARSRAMWKRIVDSLPPDYFSAADLPLLREYCEAYDRSVKAQEEIDKNMYVSSVQGGLKAHPAVAIKVAAAGVMTQVGAKLGLVRSSRRGRAKDSDGVAKPKSKRGGLMFGGKQ